MKNKRLKRIIALLLALALILGLAACGSKQDTNNGSVESAEESGASGSTENGASGSTENGASGSTESDASGSSENDASGSTEIGASGSTVSAIVVPDGFTERDFDTTYDEYETITLKGSSAETSAGGVTVNGATLTITEAGSYLLTGTLTEGQVIVNVPGQDDKVQLILDGVTMTNTSSACIYVMNADKVFITTTSGSVNELSTTGTFIATDENNVDGVIFSQGDLVLNGQGTLKVDSAQGHGVVSKDDLKITSGTYDIEAADKGLAANDFIGIAGGEINIVAGDDGMNCELDTLITAGTITINAVDDAIHSDAKLTVDGGTFNLTAAEGLEGTLITINDGVIGISASDDGINAAQKVTDYTPTLEINGGEITVVMGQGDTDAMDSNGYIYINGGIINITAQSPFDFDLGGEITGGEVYVNGQQITTLTNQFGMGGMGGMTQGGFPGNPNNGSDPSGQGQGEGGMPGQGWPGGQGGGFPGQGGQGGQGGGFPGGRP